MVLFHQWEIAQSGGILAQQYDHLSRDLTVQGELPEGYSWAMLVQSGNALDIIPLSPTQDGISTVLTESQLSAAGWYSLQLRGTKGACIRHTNVIQAYVPASLSGTDQWPTIPSEFTQLEAKLEALNAHPPVPGESGCWLIWDTETGEYAESQFPLPSGGEGGSNALWYPVLSEEGVLSWQRSSSALAPNPQDINGAPGQDGASAYEQAAEAGYTGTLAEFTAALAGVGNKQDTLIASGATVGQIAKISAVDENGKPTAWETVAMPGGGEVPLDELPKLGEITIAENEVSVVEFTSLNNITRFVILYESPKLDGTSNVSGCKVFINGTGSNFQVIEIPSYWLYTNINRIGIIFGEKVCGKIKIAGQAIQADREQNKTDFYKAESFSARDAVTSIRLELSAAGKYYNTGTTFVLRGA